MSICFLRSKLMLSDLREHDGASSLSCPFSFGLQRTDKMGGGISISWMHRKRAFPNNENGEGNLTIFLWAEKHSFLLYLKKDIHRALFMAYAVALRIFFSLSSAPVVPIRACHNLLEARCSCRNLFSISRAVVGHLSLGRQWQHEKVLEFDPVVLPKESCPVIALA